MEEYRNHLTQAGFVDVHFQSLTPAWVQWCVNRSHQYEASKEEQIRMHCEKVFNQRSSFYSDVKNLFLSGK
jgi:shikimate kinase